MVFQVMLLSLVEQLLFGKENLSKLQIYVSDNNLLFDSSRREVLFSIFSLFSPC